MTRVRVSGGLRAGVVIGAAIALLGFGVGATVASIPASAGTINACYSTATGALRVIDYPSHHCASGERLLRWNQASTAGAVPLLALQGTACSAVGAEGEVYVDVAQGTGAVTFTCKTLLSVQSTVKLATIDLLAYPSGQPPARECLNATSCSVPLPYGWTSAQVIMTADTDFLYTCPGALAEPGNPNVTRTIFHASCSGITMGNDQTVAVAGR
jgi:hypothetical protein